MNSIIRFISGLLHFDRTNWKAVSLCLLAASVFWLFNAFNKNHSANIQFPLAFEFNKEKYAPLQSLPEKINLNVSGNGWDLFTENLGFKLPHLLIPIDRPLETKKMVGASLVPTLAGQLHGLHINYVVTDTLKFQLDVRDRHTFKLVADLSKLTFEKGYGRISPVVILPNSVSIDGPQSILHSLPDSIPLAVSETGIQSNYKSELEIELDRKNFLSRNPTVAKVIFEVGRVEEIKKKIKLLRKGLPTGDSVSVVFQIPVNKVADFQLASKEVVAFIKNTSVRCRRVPSYALVIRVDSLATK